jgi:hypothetical protein
MRRLILFSIVLASLTRCGRPEPLDEKRVCPEGCDIAFGFDRSSGQTDAGVR